MADADRSTSSSFHLAIEFNRIEDWAAFVQIIRSGNGASPEEQRVLAARLGSDADKLHTVNQKLTDLGKDRS